MVTYGALYALVVGGVGGIAGWMFDLAPVKDMPNYAWVLLITAAFAVAQFQAFHKVRIERDTFTPEKAKGDLCIRDTFEYLNVRSKWGNNRDELDAFRELRQAAMDGDVWIWGRLYSGNDGGSRPLDRIQREYWRDHGLREEVITVDRDEDRGINMTQADQFTPRRELFGDLHLNDAQVRRRWPRR